MGLKRKAEKASDKEPSQNKKTATSKNTGEPFDPSLPRNTSFPDHFSFPARSPGTVTVASYNVASLRASLNKGFRKYVDAEDADILCIQETKVNSPIPEAVDNKRYPHRYWSFEEKKGYGGTAIFSKHKPTEVKYGIPSFEDQSRGRVISLTFPSFVLVACYVPNAGEKLVRLPERRVFNDHMEKYIRSLQAEGKSVIWVGDLNVAHTPNDLARPKTNERSPGFTIEERTDFTKVLTPHEGHPALIDTWRHFHPDTKGHYTYYSYRFKCREKLIGWRLDYFVVTPDLMDKIVSSDIRHEVWGASDHVPLVLTLNNVNLDSA